MISDSFIGFLNSWDLRGFIFFFFLVGLFFISFLKFGFLLGFCFVVLMISFFGGC